MSFSYGKLWKILIDRGMTKEQFRKMANLSPATSAAMSKGAGISSKVMERICVALKLQPGDFLEYVEDAPPLEASRPAVKPPVEALAESAELLRNIHKIRVTELGAERIRRNIGMKIDNVTKWCTQKIKKADSIERRGKNWYVNAGKFVITINAQTYNIVTAHKK